MKEINIEKPYDSLSQMVRCQSVLNRNEPDPGGPVKCQLVLHRNDDIARLNYINKTVTTHDLVRLCDSP
jgi:hypothetical protein